MLKSWAADRYRAVALNAAAAAVAASSAASERRHAAVAPPADPSGASPASSDPPQSSSRDLRLDFFRGISLILIFIDHIPYNLLSYFTLQAVAFFDAAEVFIFISGFTAAFVYGRRLATRGIIYATAQVWRRAWQLYVAHVFLFVLFVAEVSYTAATFKNPMYTEEMRIASFLDEPYLAVIKALMLQFQPNLLDILPMYIVLLLIFPAVLLGLRRHWRLVLLASFAVYAAVQAFGINIPAYPTGVWFFNPLAWQFLFVSGAVLANRTVGRPGALPLAIPRSLYWASVVIFAVAVFVRLTWTIHSAWEPWPALFLKELWPADKTNLSPVRLVSFFALVVLVAAHVPRNARFLGTAPAQPLIACGRHSLEIFCLGILLSALGHFVLSEYGSGLPLQLAVNAGGIAIMIVTAKVMDWYREMERASALRPVPAAGGGGASGGGGDRTSR